MGLIMPPLVLMSILKSNIMELAGLIPILRLWQAKPCCECL